MTLKALINTKLIFIKRLVKGEIQHKISYKVINDSRVKVTGKPSKYFSLTSPPGQCRVPSSAAAKLEHLTHITLAAFPERKKWKKRNCYEDHWSPTYAALHAQLLAMLNLQRHL